MLVINDVNFLAVRLVFSPNNRFLFAFAPDGNKCLIDLAESNVPYIPEHKVGDFRNAVFSSDSSTLFTAIGAAGFAIFDMTRDTIQEKLTPVAQDSRFAIGAILPLSPNDVLFSYGTTDNNTWIRGKKSKKGDWRFSPVSEPNLIYPAAVSPFGPERHFVAAERRLHTDSENQVSGCSVHVVKYIMDKRSLKESETLFKYLPRKEDELSLQLSASSDSPVLRQSILISDPKRDRHYAITMLGMECADWKTGEVTTVVAAAPKSVVMAVAFSASHDRLFYTQQSSAVKVMSAEDYSPVNEIDWGIGQVAGLTISDDGSLAAVHGKTGKICVWDVE